jgi:DNA transposition AAA+ family ATPase
MSKIAIMPPADDDRDGDRKETGASPAKDLAPVDRSLAAEASSAHSRINIPLSLDNWKGLSPEVQNELLWFHQHCLDEGLGQKEACEAVGYDWTTVYRVLKGIYDGAYDNFIKRVRSYRRLAEQRARIQLNEFVETPISKIIWTGLNYAHANSTITVIEAESRMGKTTCAKAWAVRNNHGRSIFATAPVVGGVSALIRILGSTSGIDKNRQVNDIVRGLYKALNKNRIIIIDEAHRLLPNDTRVINPQKVELLRDLHDRTGCAIAFLVTARWVHHLKKGAYQYEQLVGRIGMPIRIRPKIGRDEVLPIIRQYIKAPPNSLVERLLTIANEPGRLGIMVETLKVASIIANSDKESLSEIHVLKAIAMRTRHSGEAK